MPYIFPTPALLGAPTPAVPAATWARTGLLRLRHDDADRPRHVGGGARRRPTRALTAADLVLGGAPRRLRLLPPARPPRDAHRVRRLVLPQQRRDRRRRACATRLGGPVAIVDIDAHHGNGAQAIFYERRRRAARAPSTSTRRRAGSRTSSASRARRRGRRHGREPQRPARRRARGDGRVARGGARSSRAGRRARARALVVALGVDAAAGDPESPLAGDARTATARPAARSARSACRPWSCRRAATISRHDRRRSCSPRWPGWPTGSRTEARLTIWVGKDEHEGIPVQDAQGPQAAAALAARGDRRHRAAALARARRRPHARGLHPGPRHLRRLAARPRPGAIPERLTTGRDPMPYWEDTEPRLSPDGTQVAYADDGHVWLVPAAGGPPRKLLEAGSPGLDRRRDARRLGRARATRAASPSSTSPTRGRAGSPRPRRPEATATSGARPSRPTAPRSPTSSRRAPTSTAPRSASPTSPAAPSRALTGTPRHAGPRARLVARRRDARVRLRALRLVGAAPRRRATARRAAAHRRRRRLRRARLAPGRRPARGRARRRNRFDLVDRRRRDRRGRPSSRPAASGARRTGPPTARSSPPTRTTPRRRSCGSSTRGDAPVPLLAPTPLAVRARRTSRPRTSSFASLDGLEIPAFLFRPRDASAERPCPRSSTRTAARPTPTATSGTGTRSTSSTRATPGSRSTSAARPATAATSSGRTTASGASTTRRTASPPPTTCATLDWVDGDRLGDLRRELRLLHGAARRSPTTPSIASAARCASTATATSSPRGRRATARASRTSSG